MQVSGANSTNSLSAQRTRGENVHPVWFGIGLILMAILLTVALSTYRPPAPKPTSDALNEFSAARALILAERLLGNGDPHPIGTAANAAVREVVIGELSALGYMAQTQETLGCRTAWATCGYVTNILTRLPGQEAGPAVLLTAHYDSVGAGPGAADDIAGVAAILEIARILQSEAPFPNPVILLLSDGEEPGLLGAEAFIAEHPWADEVGVVVNLEASGTSGPSILFETTDNNSWLLEVYRSRAPFPAASSLFDELIAFTTQNTDLAVYEANGLPVVNFAFVEESHNYHTPLDNLDTLDPASVQHHGDNALASVRAFAEMDLANPPNDSSLVIDVLPGLLLQWPESWTTWLALAGFVLLVGVAIALIRQGELSMPGVLWSQLVVPVGLLVAGGVGFTWSMGLSVLTGAPVPWYAFPLPMRVAVWTLAVATVLLLAVLTSRRAGFWGLSLGIWTWWTLLAAITGWLAPGFSVMLLPPALLGALTLTVVVLSPLRTRPLAREIAALVGLAGTSWFWLPFALGVENTQGGTELGALIACSAALAVSAIAPFVAVPAAQFRLRRWSLASAALIAVVATVITLVVPVYSAERPQRLNLLHLEQRHLGEASRLIETDQPAGTTPSDVPPALLTAEQFGEAAVTAFPWSDHQYLSAPAAETEALAPTIDVLSDDAVDGNRLVRLQLHSPRGADKLSLYVSEAAAIHQIIVTGTLYVTAAPDAEHGYFSFHCHALACDGVTVELDLNSNEAVDLFIVDWTPGLPADGAALLGARPETAVPSQDGDGTFLIDRISLAAL